MGDTYEKLASIFRPEAEMMDMMWMMMVSGAVMMFMFCYIFHQRGYEGKVHHGRGSFRRAYRVFDGGADGDRSARYLSRSGAMWHRSGSSAASHH